MMSVKSVWVPAFELLKNSGGQPLIDNIVGVLTNNLGTIDAHALPFPFLQAVQQLLIKVVRKPLSPGGKFLLEVFVEHCLQRVGTSCLLESCASPKCHLSKT